MARKSLAQIVVPVSAIVAVVLLALFGLQLRNASNAPTDNQALSTTPCDKVGDAGYVNDCIHQEVPDGSFITDAHPGKAYASHLTISPALQGKDLTVAVQYRALNADGAPGSWWTHKRILWTAEDTSRSRERDITSCAPQTPGNYQMRTVVVAPQSQRTLTASALAKPAVFNNADARFSVIPVASTTANCEASSPQDQENVELFNQGNFEMVYQINAEFAQDGSATLTMSCPQFPANLGSTLSVELATQDGSQISRCGAGNAIRLSTAQIAESTNCVKSLCDLKVIASNNQTGTIYSQTDIRLTVNASLLQTFIPTLNPATVPVCNDTLSACLLSRTCTLSTDNIGELRLCSDPSSCSTPSDPATGYSVSSTVTFTVALNDKLVVA